jgi:hypothetical protein
MARISNDPLKAFVALRSSLEARRAKLVADIAEIDAALGSLGVGTPGKGKGAAAPKAKTSRAANKLSLKEAVIESISKAPLSKEDILLAVKKLGYRFASKNPVNSLNALLYGKKPKFKNTDGKFSLA